MSGGIEEKQPGSSSLVDDTFSGAAQDTPGPGKRTLAEQLTDKPVQRKAGADGGRDLSFDRYEDRSFSRYIDRSFEPTSIQRKAASSAPDRISGLSDKEAATDIPSWARNWPDARPGVQESGTTFATRLMNKEYGVGQWPKTVQQSKEFSRLKKFSDRAFK